MNISKLIGQSETPLTVTDGDVIMPETLPATSRLLSIGCIAAGEFIKFTLTANDGTIQELFPDEKIIIPFIASPGQILFKASAPGGAGTLQIGYWT